MKVHIRPSAYTHLTLLGKTSEVRGLNVFRSLGFTNSKEKRLG